MRAATGLTLLVLLCGCGTQTTMRPAVPRSKVICFGDSITYGLAPTHGVGDGTNWVDVLETKCATVETINAGRNWRAVTDAEALPALRATLQQHPDVEVVILWLGTNDMIGYTPKRLPKILAAMERVIDLTRALRPRAKVVLCAPPGINPAMLSEMHTDICGFDLKTLRHLERLGQAYRALAARKRVHFISLFDAVSPPNFIDGVHPSREGHAQIAEAMRRGLQQERVLPSYHEGTPR